MLKEFLDTILDLKKPEKIDVDGNTYIGEGYKPAILYYPEVLNTTTLTSIVDFYKEDIDAWNKFKCFIHVHDQQTVSFESESHGDFNQRLQLVKASAIVSKFVYGQQYDLEEFIVALNSQFEPNKGREYLLNLVSSLSLDSSAKNTDNGMSQSVAVKSSITLKEEVEIKNPVKLKPFRTFTEIEQPESEFLFRVESRNGFMVSLHPCDGAKWRMKAIQDIKAFFATKLKKIPVIA